MFRELQITLYDIFGYLLPGSVVTLAAVVGLWAVLWPTSTFLLPVQLPALATTYLLLICYLAGHLAQAMSNIVERFSKSSTKFETTVPLSAELEKLVRAAATKHLGHGAGNVSARELYLLCDQALIHNRSVGEREIFIYREGFYRGNSVALAALAISLFLRTIHSPIQFSIGPRIVDVHRTDVALCAVLTSVGSWLAYRRYLRFHEHKIQTCFLRFLSLWTSNPSTEKKENGGT